MNIDIYVVQKAISYIESHPNDKIYVISKILYVNLWAICIAEKGL